MIPLCLDLIVSNHCTIVKYVLKCLSKKRKVMKDFVPVIVVFLLMIVGGLFVVNNNKHNNSQEASQERSIAKAQEATDKNIKLIIGNPEAKATMVEYLDYKCPNCNDFDRTTGAKIESDYVDTDLANIEIRITPILGPDSANAARGAYCANEQNKFKQYHKSVLNYMYKNYYSSGKYSAESQNILTTSTLAKIVEPIGIETGSFRSCVESKRYNPNLDNNLQLAADDGVRGTPGFAIGSQSFVGKQAYSVYKTLLDIELK